jgi:hypothetical protein
MASSRRQGVIVLGLSALVGLFYLATLREGHRWGDDFSLYILHARNIVEGRPYADTGYLYNPQMSAIGPPTYPPLFPLLLAPVYAIYGLDLEAMKLVFIVFFMAALWMSYLLLRREIPFPYLVALIAFVGLNHYFWNLKDNILSDIPFLAFLYLVFFLIRRVHGEDPPPRGRLLPAFLAGLTLYLCYGTRSVGVILLPCLLIHDLVRFRRITALTGFAFLAIVPVVLLLNVLLHSDIQYFESITFEPDLMLHKLRAHAYSLMVLWDNGRSEAVHASLFVIFNGLVIAGYLAKVRRRLDVQDVFAIVYPVILVFLPPRATIRYLIPVIPLYAFYGLLGLRCLASRRPAVERAAFIVLLAAIAGSYVSKYSTTDFGPFPRSVTSQESRALFDFIERETGEDAVILFRKPRALALFTGRTAAYHKALRSRRTLRYLERIGARYVIVSPKDRDPGELGGFIRRNPDNFRLIYDSGKYTVHRVLSYERGRRERSRILRPGSPLSG